MAATSSVSLLPSSSLSSSPFHSSHSSTLLLCPSRPTLRPLTISASSSPSSPPPPPPLSPPLPSLSSSLSSPAGHSIDRLCADEEDSARIPETLRYLLPLGTVILASTLFDCQDAWAVSGEFGILEGRSAALIHPIAMGGLFAYTLWVGYLGWQWRQVRTIQNEINELKKEVKPVSTEGAPAPPSAVELKIKDLTEARKVLVKGGFRDRHFNAGSILLAFGVAEAVGGCVNTWMRTGKLFPGPHLFAGAGITVLWALAAGLVPLMQKGNETARSLHIALNAVNVILFIWQIPTGLDIVYKVFEFTKWP